MRPEGRNQKSGGGKSRVQPGALERRIATALDRRAFIKRGALLMPAIFIPRLIRAQSALTAEGLASFTPPVVSGGGGGGGDFLTGISLRYVADDVSGTDGATISSWPDSSGNSRNANSISGGQNPVIKVGVVNGHRAVQFDGTDDVLAAVIAPIVIGTATATTVFIVLKQTGTQARNTPIGWIDASSNKFVIHATYDDVIYFDHENSSTGRVSGNQPAGWNDAWHVLECYRSGATMQILVDGSTVATTSSASSSFVQTGSDNFCIGALNISGGVALKGQIAELRVYPTAVGSTDCASIRAALKSTYGTP